MDPSWEWHLQWDNDTMFESIGSIWSLLPHDGHHGHDHGGDTNICLVIMGRTYWLIWVTNYIDRLYIYIVSSYSTYINLLSGYQNTTLPGLSRKERGDLMQSWSHAAQQWIRPVGDGLNLNTSNRLVICREIYPAKRKIFTNHHNFIQGKHSLLGPHGWAGNQSRRKALLYPRCHQFQKRTRISAPS